jgi:hypothetical protein
MNIYKRMLVENFMLCLIILDHFTLCLNVHYKCVLYVCNVMLLTIARIHHILMIKEE